MRQDNQTIAIVKVIKSEQTRIEVNRMQFPIVIGIHHIGLPAVVRYSQTEFIHDNLPFLRQKRLPIIDNLPYSHSIVAGGFDEIS